MNENPIFKGLVANALKALDGKSVNDVIGADTTEKRLCKQWLERELFPGGTLDMETTIEYVSAFILTKTEGQIMRLVDECTSIVAARRLLHAVAYDETAGERLKAVKAKKDAVKAAKHYCYIQHKHGKGAFTAYKNALNAAMPELDAQDEWQGEDEEIVSEYVLSLHGL